jgi:hypothetical protein
VGLPHSPVEFSSHCYFYKLSTPGCWACAAPAFSSQIVCLQFREGFPSPNPRRSGCPTLFATCLFCCCCLLVSFSFFPWVGLVCPESYAALAQGCLCEYHVPLSSPCGPHLPKLFGHCRLAAAWEPSWFLHLMWSGDAMCRLEVWRGQSFASSRWFFLLGESPVSLQDFTLGDTLSASSL